MTHSRIYRSGRGLRPRPVRIRALDRTVARRRGCAVLAAVVAVSVCCGGGLFGMVVLVLDW